MPARLRQRQTLGEVGCRLPNVALVERHMPQVVQHYTCKLLDAQFTSESQAVLAVDFRLRIVLFQPGNFSQAVE